MNPGQTVVQDVLNSVADVEYMFDIHIPDIGMRAYLQCLSLNLHCRLTVVYGQIVVEVTVSVDTGVETYYIHPNVHRPMTCEELVEWLEGSEIR